MGPTWGPTGADRTHVGPMNFAIWVMLFVVGATKYKVYLILSVIEMVVWYSNFSTQRANNVEKAPMRFSFYATCTVKFSTRFRVEIQFLNEHMCWGSLWFTVTQIAKFVGPTWGPPGSCWTQMGPMLAPWTLLSGKLTLGISWFCDNWTTILMYGLYSTKTCSKS